jgi:poly(A) polymerase
MAALLANVPASRLFDEMIKLLQTGHALASIDELRKQGLHRGVFPVLDAVLATPATRRSAEPSSSWRWPTPTARGRGQAVAPSFMLACMLWHDVQRRWDSAARAGEPPFPALQQAIDAVFDARIGDISGRGKLAADMREIWLMQPRFERRTAIPPSLVEQPRFRAGFDFLRLRADAGEVDAELADWWEDYHLGSDEEREALLAAVREAQRSGPRRSGSRRGAATADASLPAPVMEPEGESQRAPGPDEVEPMPRPRQRRGRCACAQASPAAAQTCRRGDCRRRRWW